MAEMQSGLLPGSRMPRAPWMKLVTGPVAGMKEVMVVIGKLAVGGLGILYCSALQNGRTMPLHYYFLADEGLRVGKS